MISRRSGSAMVRVAVALLIALALLGGAVYAAYWLNHTTIKPQKPPGKAVPLALPPVASHFRAPLSVTTATLRAMMEAAVPKNFTGTAKDGAHKDRKIDYNVSRGDISASNDVAAARFRASAPFGGHAQFEDKESVFITTINISVGFDASGRLDVSTAPRFTSDWAVDPQLQVGIKVDNAVVKAGILGDVGVTDLMQRAINKLLEDKSGEISAKVAEQLLFKSNVEEVWKRIPSVIKVNEDPPTWVRLEPTAVGIKKFQYSADRIESGFEFTTEVDVTLGKKPASQSVPLPPLDVKDELPRGFMIVLPARISYDVINAELTKAIGKDAITIPDANGWVRFTSCTVEPYGSGILLAVGFKGRRGWLKSISGVLYITGKLQFDAGKTQFSCKDLAFTAETNSELVNLASWLASPLVVQALQQFSVVDLSGEVPRAKEQANAQIAKLKAGFPPEIKAKLEITKLDVDDLRFATDCASITVRAEGNMSAELQ